MKDIEGTNSAEFLFVGNVLPAVSDDYLGETKSATIEIQRNLLDGFINNRVRFDIVLSVLNYPRMPHYKFKWMLHKPILYKKKLKIVFLGLCNIEPLKTLSIGLHGFLKSFFWGMKKRMIGRKPIFFLYNMGPTHHQIPFFWCAARLCGARIFSLVTDVYPPKAGWLSRAFFENFSYALQTFSLRHLDGFVALNDNVIKDFGSKEKCTQLQGLIPDDATVLKMAELPLLDKFPKKKFIITYLGSLNHARGVELLLEAFKDTPKHWRLVIAGKGECEESVKNAQKEDSRIKFKGFISDSDKLVKVISKSTCLINPHRVDDPLARYIFPSKLTEYMASGRPVVSTNHGNVRDFYADFIWITDDDSPEAIRRTLSELADSPFDIVGKRIKKARKYVLKNKLWKQNIEKIINFCN